MFGILPALLPASPNVLLSRAFEAPIWGPQNKLFKLYQPAYLTGKFRLFQDFYFYSYPS